MKNSSSAKQEVTYSFNYDRNTLFSVVLIRATLPILKYSSTSSVLIVFVLQSLAIAENEENAPNVRVDGIMYDKDNPMAVVNDQVLRKGESIEGAKITEITDAEVTFQ